MFYHIKNLQSTKTSGKLIPVFVGFITLRIYKVLKLRHEINITLKSFITLRIYKVLKQDLNTLPIDLSFITLRIYKVLKLRPCRGPRRDVLSH